MNNDCVFCIFAMLNVSDIVNCLYVCKRFYTIAKNNLLWKQLFKVKFYNVYTIENNFYDSFKKYSILNNFLVKNSKINVNMTIVELYLSYNQLQSIPKELGQLASLQKLYLCNNQLQTIPKELGQLARLQRLYLSNNQLHIIPKELGQLASLQELYLDNNQLQSIPKELGQLSMLQELSLS